MGPRAFFLETDLKSGLTYETIFLQTTRSKIISTTLDLSSRSPIQGPRAYRAGSPSASSSEIYIIDRASLVRELGVATETPTQPVSDLFPWLYKCAPGKVVPISPPCLIRAHCHSAFPEGNLDGNPLPTLKDSLAVEDIFESLDYLTKQNVTSSCYTIRSYKAQAGIIALVSDVLIYAACASEISVALKAARRLAEYRQRAKADPQVRAVTPEPRILVYACSTEDLIDPDIRKYLAPVGELTDSIDYYYLSLFGKKSSALPNYPWKITSNEKVLGYSSGWGDTKRLTALKERLVSMAACSVSPLARADEVCGKVWQGNSLDAGLDDMQQERSFRVRVRCSTKPTLLSVSELDALYRQTRRKATAAHGTSAGANAGTGLVKLGFYSTKSLLPRMVAGNAELLAYIAGLCQTINAFAQDLDVLIHASQASQQAALFTVIYFMFCSGETSESAISHLYQRGGFDYIFSEADADVLGYLQPFLHSFGLQGDQKKPLGIYSSKQVGEWLNLSVPTGDLSLIKDWGVEQLPARLLDNLFLGSKRHAQHSSSLSVLGISRVLSVGEAARRSSDLAKPEPNVVVKDWVKELSEVLYINKLEDDGKDYFGEDRLQMCIDFVLQGMARGESTLIHCQRGVSRSATVAIAVIMHELRLTVYEAMIYVRARRLSVIIQPNLKLLWELMEFEYRLYRSGHLSSRSCWATLCRDIAILNDQQGVPIQ